MILDARIDISLLCEDTDFPNLEGKWPINGEGLVCSRGAGAAVHGVICMGDAGHARVQKARSC